MCWLKPASQVERMTVAICRLPVQPPLTRAWLAMIRNNLTTRLGQERTQRVSTTDSLDINGGLRSRCPNLVSCAIGFNPKLSRLASACVPGLASMSIDKFGLGDWWPRPAQAAVGALDHLPADQWPALAAKWLAAGFDSSPLRRLAQLHPGEPPARLLADRRKSSRGGSNWNQPLELGQLPAEAERLLRQRSATLEAIELMPEALRSIGFDPAPANEEFTGRCQKALDIVQHDLDATGYGQYQMRAHIGQGWPAIVFAALPDGSHWSGGGGMARGEDGPSLLASAAESVSEVLKEIPEIEWPVCAVHGGHPTSIWDGEDPVKIVKKVPWWRCTNTGHLLAPVGQLTAEIANTP
jgi:hypothetical protein